LPLTGISVFYLKLEFPDVLSEGRGVAGVRREAAEGRGGHDQVARPHCRVHIWRRRMKEIQSKYLFEGPKSFVSLSF
jgi:hypothetical protein